MILTSGFNQVLPPFKRFIYLSERQSDRGSRRHTLYRERESARFHLLGHSPNACSCQDWARSQELHPDLPHEWQRPKYLVYHPLPSHGPLEEAGSEAE